MEGVNKGKRQFLAWKVDLMVKTREIAYNMHRKGDMMYNYTIGGEQGGKLRLARAFIRC